MEDITRLTRRLMTYRVHQYMKAHANSVVPVEEIANELETRLADVSGCLSHLARTHPIHAVVNQVREVKGFWYYGDLMTPEQIDEQLTKYF